MVSRARAMVAAGEFDGVADILRSAAEQGDVDAAQELGRLLSLTGSAWEDLASDGLGPLGREERWEPEWWLSRVVAERPDDPDALVLLAGLWTGMSAFADVFGGPTDNFREKSAGRYARALATHPDCAAAASSLLMLQGCDDDEWEWDPAEAGLSFLLFRSEILVSNSGDTVGVAIVATDPADMRWALHHLLPEFAEALEAVDGPDAAELLVYQHGVLETRLDLVDLDVKEWPTVQVPGLVEPRLPLGHPVRVGDHTYLHGCTFNLPY
ncbi:hypothetical protein [Plantactinospora mayteni]|uniref:hypothetical protein n=1 Tax=Plantactinospora mayteni TaxID=566021 RepID=UPI0019422593|nr:hypothetical protein [Plantactinospora mayteni]